MIIHAGRRPRTAHDFTGEWEVVHWSVETDDYDTGMDEVRDAIPEGWLLLGVRVDR